MSNFVKIIREICKENDIFIQGFSDDWAFLLKKDGKQAYIYGYQFGLDLASFAQAVCKDKAIASDILEYENIPHVPHTCIMSPAHPEYLFGNKGNYRTLLSLLEKEKTLVCKDNQGTGGDLVFVCKNEKELEYAASKIFAESGSMAVSPYVDIEDEIRCIMLDGQLQVAFSKIRPSLIGDGVSTISKLLSDRLLTDREFSDRIFSGASISYDDLHGDKAKLKENYVPKKGEVYTLSWKHNLGQGARAKLLYPSENPEECRESERKKEAFELAKKVVSTFGLRFVSVDIVRVNGTYMVLEINNGVMMENLAGTSQRDYAIAKKIYQEAILKMLSQ